MKAVLYTHDMMPITIVRIPPEWEAFLWETRNFRLHVFEPFKFQKFRPSEPPERCTLRIVHITAEVFIRNGEKHLMLFTADEESALIMQSEFLPGQMRELQDREQRAFSRGFFEAVKLGF